MARLREDLLLRRGHALLALERLVAGLAVGERLPSERELALRLAVSRQPVRRAVGELRRRGILETRHGSGTRVRRRLVERTVAPRRAALMGLCVPTVEWPSIARIVGGAEAAARAHGLSLTLAHDHGRPDLQLEQLAALLARRVDGLLVFPDRDNVSRAAFTALLRRFDAARIPLVMLDRPVPGARLPCVMTDTAAGMHRVGRHLVEAGRRRLAVLSWGETAGRAETDRWAGLRAALAEGGGAVVRQAALGYREDQCAHARRVVRGWIADARGRPSFDAVVAFVDDMALGAFLALREARVRMPRDVALTGFDDVDPRLYQAHGLALTTVAQPFAEIGRAAVDLLVERLTTRERSAPSAHVLLEPTLVVRASSIAGAGRTRS